MSSRHIYKVLLRLHPREFREEYAEEMLWIFDEEVQSRPASSLLWDGVCSLARQRWRRANAATTPPEGQFQAVALGRCLRAQL